MAVKTCAVTALVSGTAVALPGTTALNGSTDTITITGATDADKLLLIIENSTASSKKITIKKGQNPPAVRAGLGDLVITMTEKTSQIVAIESARFAKTDGTVEVSCEAAMTGFISAVRIPRAL